MDYRSLYGLNRYSDKDLDDRLPGVIKTPESSDHIILLS